MESQHAKAPPTDQLSQSRCGQAVRGGATWPNPGSLNLRLGDHSPASETPGPARADCPCSAAPVAGERPQLGSGAAGQLRGTRIAASLGGRGFGDVVGGGGVVTRVKVLRSDRADLAA